VRVLVTDGEDRAALASVRGLARAGHTVAVAAGSRPAPAQASRACTTQVVVPPSLAAAEFVAGLARVTRQGRFDALLPSTDAALLAVSGFRSQLPAALLEWLPPEETVARCLRKATLLDEAARAGFAVLETTECRNRGEARPLGFPIVVKPAMSIVGGRREAARIVSDAGQLDAAFAALGTPVLVQRYYAGTRILSLGGVLWHGRLVALAASRWIRRWPPLDGAASFAETVTPPPGVAERAEALIAALGWQGIFELELLQLDDRTFAPVDFNPRPFGWMTLALRAGVNLPAVWADCASGVAAGPLVAARAGVRYRWEDGDAKHLVWHLRRGRGRAAAAVLVPRRRVAHAWFEARDPWPAAAALRRLTTRG
jgi:predicted ATP-grasp superfamily ATP-dependent carboligase